MNLQCDQDPVAQNVNIKVGQKVSDRASIRHLFPPSLPSFTDLMLLFYLEPCKTSTIGHNWIIFLISLLSDMTKSKSCLITCIWELQVSGELSVTDMFFHSLKITGTLHGKKIPIGFNLFWDNSHMWD